MDLQAVLEDSLYFLALINPASKIFLLSTMEPPYTGRRLVQVSTRASVVALGILILLSAVGQILLREVFHVEIYSLQVAGGIVLFTIGMHAITRGRFYEKDVAERVDDISIVPLAAPLIAGPGTITAAISFSARNHFAATALSLALAVGMNFIFMCLAHWIGRGLRRLNATGPLIRITGLIVAAVAVQMVLAGLKDWWLAGPPAG